MRAAILFVLVALGLSARADEAWTAGTWRGERVYSAVSAPWKAVVSVERARLVYLGPVDESENLLFSTATRDNPVGWGGHRLWLGPQATWPSGGWPPPAAWEKSAAASSSVDGAKLLLELPDVGPEWPHLTREYRWEDGRVLCNARLTGGKRAVQVIHILQVPSTAVVQLRAVRLPEDPLGYVLLHLGRTPSPRRDFKPVDQVAETDGFLRVRFNGTSEKIGTKEQPLEAAIGHNRLRVLPANADGAVVSVPDDGFVTQVYLGRTNEPIIELEQLSPLWEAGRPASFGIWLAPEADPSH